MKQLLAKPVQERIGDIESITEHPWLRDYALPSSIQESPGSGHLYSFDPKNFDPQFTSK